MSAVVSVGEQLFMDRRLDAVDRVDQAIRGCGETGVDRRLLKDGVQRRRPGAGAGRERPQRHGQLGHDFADSVRERADAVVGLRRPREQRMKREIGMGKTGDSGP